ncbi:MAG TPA: alpha/beta hydrolase [Candidatus Limnocylindria bacterium]
MIGSKLATARPGPGVRRVSLDDEPFGGPTVRLVSLWTPVHGLRLHALASAEVLPPDVPTVVLVHGVAVSSRYLVPLAQRLAPRARVYVPDLPGYGRSERPRGRDLTVPELADALLAWMDRAGAERPHLLGNSFGCQVIADLASRHPDRVGRLVLQGPTMDPRARSVWRQALRWLAVVPFERPSEGLVLLRDVWDLGPRRAADMIRMALHDPIEQRLRRISAPTLVVRGTRDAIVPQRWAEDAAQLLPNGRLVVIERAAHTINYSQPAWLASVVLPFLTGDQPDNVSARAVGEAGTDSNR